MGIQNWARRKKRIAAFEAPNRPSLMPQTHSGPLAIGPKALAKSPRPLIESKSTNRVARSAFFFFALFELIFFSFDYKMRFASLFSFFLAKGKGDGRDDGSDDAG